MVEQRTENPRVGCSIHPLATIYKKQKIHGGLPDRTREHFTRLKRMTMTNGDMATFTITSATLTPAETE